MNEKVIALVDCNAFFCSCERLFRPDLKNKAVVVLSNNDGCVISRTEEAKALGIQMGEPFFKIKYLVDQKKVTIFSSNFSLYTNISDRVMMCLKKMVPSVEVYSVDEAFLDISAFQDPHVFGQLIRETILKEVGIPVGVGIAPTKVMAKAANRIAKKSKKANGVVTLLESKFQEVALSRIEIEDVWGIGRANSQKMRSLGIRTAKELRDYKNEILIQKIFTKVGLQIKQELMGINCFPFNKPVEAKKEIMCSRTFGGSVLSKDVLKESIANYVTDAAQKMRGQGSVCRELTVFARTNPYKDTAQFYLSDSKKLINPTGNTFKLIQVAHELIDLNFRDGYEYKKAGVTLSDFYQEDSYQIDLLEGADSPKDLEVMKVIDQINEKEGEIQVKSAACGVSDKAFAMNRNFKSPRYTTSWGELKLFL